MTSSTNVNIVEHVGRAVADADMEDYMEFHHLHDARARAAIRATLEYVRDNVSLAAVMAGEDAFVKQNNVRLQKGMKAGTGSRWPSEEIAELCARVSFRAMISALLLEIDQDGGKG